MRKALLTLILSAAAAAVGCQSQSSTTSDIKVLTTSSFRQQWNRDLKLTHGEEVRSMYVRGADLFVFTNKNVLYRFNRSNGVLVFVSDVAGKHNSVQPPLVLKDRIIVPADDKLHFLDQQGYIQQTIDLRTPIRTGIVGDERYLYVGVSGINGSGRVLNVNPNRPFSPFNWELMTGGVSSTPVLVNGYLYIGADDGQVYAVSADRVAVWGINHGTFKTDGRIMADLAADKNAVYVASTDTLLYALNLKDGKELWKYHGGTPLTKAPVVGAATIYLPVPGKGVVALDKTAGKFDREPKWVVADAVEFLAEDDDFAFLRNAENKIIAVDKQTGKTRFTNARTDLHAFAVNPSNGMVYAATAAGEIMAIVPVTKGGTVGAYAWVEENPQLAAR